MIDVFDRGLFISLTALSRDISIVRHTSGLRSFKFNYFVKTKSFQNKLKILFNRLDIEIPFNGIINLSTLNKCGLSFRKGKGDGQEWFISPCIAYLISDCIVDDISVEVSLKYNVSCLMDMVRDKYKPNSDGYSYTYILLDTKSGIYKIGRTSNFMARFSAIKSSNIYIEALYVLNKDIESELHEIFKYRRLDGEWFSLSKEDLMLIVTKYKFVEYNKFICESS